MATINEQVKNINDTVSKINELTTSGQQKLTPLTPITPESVNGNAQALDVSPASSLQMSPDQLTVDQLISNTENKVPDQYTQNLEDQAAAASTAESSSFEAFIQNELNADTKESIQAEQYKALGVDEKQLRVDQLQTELITEADRLRTLKENILSKGGGLKSGAASEIANAERESYAKQADIALLQLAAQDQLDYATRVADRAVDAMFSQQEKINEVLGLIYERNKSEFDKEEKRLFESKQADRERELTDQKEKARILLQTKIDSLKMLALNNAPESVKDAVARSASIEEVIASGGQYGVADLLQREQLRASIASSWASAELSTLQLEGERKKQKQIEEAIESGAVILDEAQQDMAFKLGKEYESESGEFKKQVGAYNRIIASAEEPSAAGDLALIFNYMKMLDPGSTVREGEFANAQNSAGVPSQIVARYNSVINGQRLAEEQRTDFVNRAQKLYNTSLEQQIELENRYKDKATTIFGLPENAAEYVVQDIRAVGSASDVAFGLQLDNMSTDQLADLVSGGLLPTSSPMQ